MGGRLAFKHLSLRQKLIVTSITCLVLPTIGMLYTTSVHSKIIIREHTLSKATQSLTIVQSQVDAILEEMVSISNFVQFDPEIKTLLEEAKTNPVAAKQLTARLEQIAGEKNDLRLTLLTRDGRAYSDYSFYDFKPSLFFEQSWFSEAERLSAYETLFLGGEPNYLPPQSPEQDYVYMTARALTEDTDKPPFAFLIVSRTENTLRELFLEMEETVFLLDGRQRIISNRNPDLVGVDFETILPREETGTTPSIIHWNGTNQLFLSLPLRYADWKLVSVAPYEQLTGRLNGVYHSGLFLQALFAVCFLFALTYLLGRFTRPVRTLGDAAKKVEMGDLTFRSNIRGRDEVGRLGRSFDQMLDRVQHMLKQIEMEQELKRQAEMAMLQAQVHPHFLFNVLSSIRLKLLMKGDEETAHVVGSLSSLLRASISRQSEFVTLYNEVETAKQYMDLMKFAMRYPVETVLELHTDLFSETVPRFILQPIIENAYKHGFTQSGGRIAVKVEKDDASLRIAIEDNGVGMSPETLAEINERLRLQKREVVERMAAHPPRSSSGIGLFNVYSRLKLLYGERFAMNIRSVPGCFTRIELSIPIDRAEGDADV